MSIVLADFSETAQKTKRRDVAIIKALVFRDIDLLTHKHVDGSGLQDNRVRNAVSSDYSEDVDGAVLARYVEFRDAKLRARVSFALADLYQEKATDILTLDEENYYYHFEVQEGFDDNLLSPIAEHIHRFLLYGALADWYAQFPDRTREAAFYGDKADALEDDIANALHGPSIVKRPLQPFGPAQKIY